MTSVPIANSAGSFSVNSESPSRTLPSDQMDMKKHILVTGGAGFIGSNLVHHLLNNHPDYLVVNVDSLTYAGNLANLRDVENLPNYHFVKADVTDSNAMARVFNDFSIDTVLHLAAESHVDRSINTPLHFANVNILGTLTLLDTARKAWGKAPNGKLYYQISTDEVYGALGQTGAFTETTPYNPQSPYSASKASADHFVRAYSNTYGLPTIISCCSNNYGPYQFPEKLIPLCISNILKRKPLPIYGQGLNVRDWLYVADHARAIDTILHHGTPGQTYNVGGHNEVAYIELVRTLCRIMDTRLNQAASPSENLITYVPDRLGHDFRYAIDPTKLSTTLGWKPETSLQVGLERTVDWYLSHQQWLEDIETGRYRT